MSIRATRFGAILARTRLSIALSTIFAAVALPIAAPSGANKEAAPITEPRAGQLLRSGDQAAESFALEKYVQFLHETAQMQPDPAAYEFLGYVRPANSKIWIHPQQSTGSLRELLAARGIEFQHNEQDATRGILVSADGRAYVEREEAYRSRVGRLTSMKESGASSSAGEHQLGTEPLASDAVSRQAMLKDTIFGGDGRSLITSSDYPWRAAGVALLRSYDSDNDGVDDSWSRGAGSAAMIGPRAALTVAHTISSDGNNWNVLGVGPAARGYSWCDGTGLPDASTCKFPYGLRWVQWYYWPGQWDGGGVKYDYGVLILADLNWSPGWIGFGYQTGTWLDYRNMNTAGYPSPSKSCSASPDADGECGGYMYRQYEQTTSVFTNTAYHKFDVQEGQSGAPIYNYDADSDSRVVYILHRGSEGNYAYGKRLREGSFGSICDWVGNWPSSHFNNVSC